MKKFYVIIPAVLMLFVCSNISAQTIGKLFKKAEADSIFGKVYFSQTMDSKLISEVLNDSTNVMMFRVTKDSLFIIDKHRKPVFPAKEKPRDYQVFYQYSKDMLKKLFDQFEAINEETTATVELRGSTVTITSGAFTLENACICPPLCY
jgi:hypothetical protein